VNGQSDDGKLNECVYVLHYFLTGCPYDLEFREVRCNSLVLLWAEPVYKGQSEISGYIVDISEGAESEDWTPVTSEAVTETHLKVCLVSLFAVLYQSWVIFRI